MTEKELRERKDYIRKRLKSIEFCLGCISEDNYNENFYKQILNDVEDISMAINNMQYKEKHGEKTNDY